MALQNYYKFDRCSRRCSSTSKPLASKFITITTKLYDTTHSASKKLSLAFYYALQWQQIRFLWSWYHWFPSHTHGCLYIIVYGYGVRGV
jgi:hypothetical protein